LFQREREREDCINSSTKKQWDIKIATEALLEDEANEETCGHI